MKKKIPQNKRKKRKTHPIFFFGKDKKISKRKENEKSIKKNVQTRPKAKKTYFKKRNVLKIHLKKYKPARNTSLPPT